MDSAAHPTVLLLGLPPSSLGGIDLLSFTTTPRFHGVKPLPLGWHFVFTSVTSSLSLRHGSWFRVKNADAPELYIRKWDAQKEELVEEEDEAEKLRWRANLGSIWREGLTPYRQSASKDAEAQDEKNDWAELTSCITERVLSRVLGDTPDNWALTSASSARQDLDDIPGLSQEESGSRAEKDLAFLPIDLKQTWREGAVGRERTEAAQDRSWALNALVQEHCHGDVMEVLGELQFSFLMVLTLNNYSCLEQWKRILGLLFTCVTAVTEHPELFTEFIKVLKLQLQHCEDVDGGLFDLSDEGARLLKGLIRRFKKGLQQISGKGKFDVAEELMELEDFLKSEYGWYLDDSFVRKGMVQLEDGEQVEMEVSGFEEDDETGEYAPVIVELNDAEYAAFPNQSEIPFREVTGVGNKTPGKLKANETDDEDDQDFDEMDERF